MLLTWLILVCRLFLQIASQNSCGRESIPYLLSIDLSGRPELACDTPACFGPLKSIVDDDYENEESSSKMHLNAFERTASCTGKFTELACVAGDEWTGGVNEVNNGTHISLAMECCRFQGLKYATEYKNVELRPGDRFVGGAVKERGRTIAFDLIKEIRKNVSELNEISYIVSVYRMSCVPEPNQLLNKVDLNLESGEYLSKHLSSGGQRTHISQTGYSHPRKDRYHHAKHYSSQEDYDYFQEKNENRVRPFYSRYGEYARKFRGRYGRRRYYKPVVDEYDYYEMEPIPLVRRAMYKRLKAKYDEDQLWPILYASKTKNKAHGLQNFNNDVSKKKYQDINAADTKLSFSDTETATPLVSLPGAQRDAYVQPQAAPAALLPGAAVASIPLVPAYAVQPTYTYYGTEQQNYIQPVASSYNNYDSTSSCSESCGSTTTCCNLNGMFSSMQCFSGDMLVQTLTGEKRMSELEVGDLIESVEGSLISYSPIVMFLHRKPKEPAIYLQFRTPMGGFIKLTAYHLIYVSKCQFHENLRLIRAIDVQLGDCIHVVKGSALHSAQVISVEKIEDIGIYAPLTANGNIIVNSVLASCHSNLAAQTLQQTFFSWWQELNMLAQHARLLISSVLKTFHQNDKNDDALRDESLPFGVEYLASIIEVFIPTSIFM